MKKFLIIRFSSIGDIVLTTPVIRSIRKRYPQSEIHYFTKASFQQVLQHNPYIDRLHLLKNDLSTQLAALKKERYDYVIDLHNNLRSLRVKWTLGRPHVAFHKENWQKYLMVRFKKRLQLSHIVDRYGETLNAIDASLDGEGLDFFLPEGLEEQAREEIAKHQIPPEDCLAVILGATYQTKRWLSTHFIELLNAYQQPIILLGGPDAIKEASFISSELSIPHLNAVGKHNLLMSAAMMKACRAVLTHDTGFMHIAAAFGQRVYSIWGNTVPEFGMTPYQTKHTILEVKDLACRPCSKIGFHQCPKGHFRCMTQLSPAQVLQGLEDLLA